ncbi:transposase, partial [Novosphingobium sp. AAP1]
MMAFIDAHREDLGIEPICRELAIAPSSYHEH